jgi:UDP-glucose 4-epimerase
VIPLFHDQIRAGGPVTITTSDMTRFLLPLERAVDTIIFALLNADRGETIVPKVPAANILDLAKVLIGQKKVEVKITGIRPGEKIHEIMVSDEEAWRAYAKGDYYAIQAMLPELAGERLPAGTALKKEYSSGDTLMNPQQIEAVLKENRLMLDQAQTQDGELLR